MNDEIAIIACNDRTWTVRHIFYGTYNGILPTMGYFHSLDKACKYAEELQDKWCTQHGIKFHHMPPPQTKRAHEPDQCPVKRSKNNS